ncbi:MAG: GNAT family N-acetyltransferase [Gemmatimonadetes bacterium]|nr:GNAT family N-acetyltransferase [Gemmatimonadota bacterium]
MESIPSSMEDRAVGRIRPFRSGDIPAVAALRQQVFRFSERRTGERLAAYFERMFFGNPWVDDDLSSLVFEDQMGRVRGFLGVVPRRMLFRGRSIRVAVATQLMVAPGSPGLIGRRFARALISGPQDLTISDAANDAARRIWEGVGGGSSAIHSLTWTRSLAPCRYAAFRLGRGALRPLALVARPFCRAADRLTTSFPAPAGHEELLRVSDMASHADAMMSDRVLRPIYEDGALEWLLCQVADKRQFGALHRVLVRNERHDVIGWFLYFLRPGAVAQVLQIAARGSAADRVLDHLLHHAWRQGAIALSGRVEPAWLPELAARNCAITRDGPWMLVHARQPEILCAIERGQAFLSRLEGEWWMSF